MKTYEDRARELADQIMPWPRTEWEMKRVVAILAAELREIVEENVPAMEFFGALEERNEIVALIEGPACPATFHDLVVRILARSGLPVEPGP